MDSNALKKAARRKTHAGLGNMKQRYKSTPATKGGGKTLHAGQPVSLAGKGLKTGHSGNNC